MQTLKFDELSTLKAVDVMYERILADCEEAYRELYGERYTEMWLFLEDREPEEDDLDELVEMYLARMLDEPDENTHYAFRPELIRKRDRAKEAILAVPTKAQKQLELEKAARYVAQQAAWYADFTSQDAEIQAFLDAGVKKVRRHEMRDDRVCAQCRRLDGTVYETEKIPALPHLRCRRWFEPVK